MPVEPVSIIRYVAICDHCGKKDTYLAIDQISACIAVESMEGWQWTLRGEEDEGRNIHLHCQNCKILFDINTGKFRKEISKKDKEAWRAANPKKKGFFPWTKEEWEKIINK